MISLRRNEEKGSGRRIEWRDERDVEESLKRSALLFLPQPLERLSR